MEVVTQVSLLHPGWLGPMVGTLGGAATDRAEGGGVVDVAVDPEVLAVQVEDHRECGSGHPGRGSGCPDKRWCRIGGWRHLCWLGWR